MLMTSNKQNQKKHNRGKTKKKSAVKKKRESRI